jgi:hypothetical protein
MMSSFHDYIQRRQGGANPMADAAVSLGLPVFPCGADKRPLTAHGFKDASADPARVRTLFSGAQATMIGVPTGEITDVVIIDVDRKENRQGGDWLAANSHRMPQTRTIRTGSGGLHIYLKHPGQRVKNSNDKIAPGIDVRGDGGYVIVPPSPGYSVADDAPIADMPDWILAVVCPPEPVHVHQAPRPVRSSSEGGTAYGLAALDDECRAIDRAYFGQQEATLNSSALKIGALVAGGELEESPALAELLSSARSMPSQPGKKPWSPAELERKARRAFQDGLRNPRSAPDQPLSPDAPHPAAAFLAKLYARSNQGSTKPLPVTPGLMDVDGVLKDLVDACAATAIRPQPFLALGAAICTVGALAGRRYRTQTDLRTNVYIAAIAESGGGKDHAPEIVRRALVDAGLDHYLGGENLASGRAVLSSIQQHPARLFQVDELGLFLRGVTGKNAPSHRAEIWSELMKLYSRAKGVYGGTEYADQKLNARVNLQSPHVCFYGTTTPHTFWSALEGGAMADGSLARFLVFVTDNHRPERNKSPEIFRASDALKSSLQAISEGAEGHDSGGNLAAAMQASVPMEPYTVRMSAEAADLHDRKLDTEDEWALKVAGTPSAAIVNRLGENAAKLALIRSVSRDPKAPEISLQDVQWGWALSEHCVRTLLEEAGKHVANTDYEAKLNKAREIIRKHGPVTESELIRRGLKLPERERQEILRTLTTSGEVLAVPNEIGPSGGRPTIRYVAAGAVAETQTHED